MFDEISALNFKKIRKTQPGSFEKSPLRSVIIAELSNYELLPGIPFLRPGRSRDRAKFTRKKLDNRNSPLRQHPLE